MCLRWSFFMTEFIWVHISSLGGSNQYPQSMCQEKIRYHNFSSENCHFYSILQRHVNIKQGSFVALSLANKIFVKPHR